MPFISEGERSLGIGEPDIHGGELDIPQSFLRDIFTLIVTHRCGISDCDQISTLLRHCQWIGDTMRLDVIVETTQELVDSWEFHMTAASPCSDLPTHATEILHAAIMEHVQLTRVQNCHLITWELASNGISASSFSSGSKSKTFKSVLVGSTFFTVTVTTAAKYFVINEKPTPSHCSPFNKKTGLPIASSPDPRKSNPFHFGSPFVNHVTRENLPIGPRFSSKSSAPKPTTDLDMLVDETEVVESVEASLLSPIGACSNPIMIRHSPSSSDSDSVSSSMLNSSSNVAFSTSLTPSDRRDRIAPSVRSSLGAPFALNSPTDSGRFISFAGQTSTTSTSPCHLVGSWDQSLFAGRMGTMSHELVNGFVAEIGANGRGKCSKHVSVSFVAEYYKLPGEDTPSPYAGTISLREVLTSPKHPGLYRCPDIGIIQVVVFNPLRTAIKLFVIRYDFTDMPARTKTFIRQRTVSKEPPKALRYGIHVKFVKTRKHIYLHHSIRVVFSHRTPDGVDSLEVITEGPLNPKYTPLNVDDVAAIKGNAELGEDSEW